MAWRLPGDKPLYEPMMFSLLTHICVAGPQWVNLNSLNNMWEKTKFTISANVVEYAYVLIFNQVYKNARFYVFF